MMTKSARAGWPYIVTLALIAMAITMYMAVTHRVVAGGDWLFHASRVEEIYQNLRHGGHLTFIGARYFHNTGVGTFLFYPSVYLYLWALLRFVLSPITAYYAWYGIVQVTASLISYYSVNKITKNRLVSFIFALLFVYSPYRLQLGINVLGEFAGTAFIPLALWGIYRILWGDKRWVTLGVALALMGYAHVLTVVLTLEMLILLWAIRIVQVRKVEWSRVKSLLMSGGLALLLVAFELIPFFTDFIGRGISTTKQEMWAPFNVKELIFTSLGVQPGGSVGFFLVVTLLLGWCFLRNRRDGVIYALAVMFFVLSTSTFPWQMFAHTPLSVIQFSYRYLPYTILFLALLLSKEVASYVNWRVGNAQIPLWGWGVALVILTLVCTIGGLSSGRQYLINGGVPPLKRITALTTKPLPLVVLDRSNYQSQFKYMPPYGPFDYYPQVAFKSRTKQQSIIRHITYVNRQGRQYPVQVGDNKIGYKVDLSHSATVNLPIIKYARTMVKVNGALTPAKVSDRGTILVRLNRGQTQVTAFYEPSIIWYVALVVAGGTWLGLIIWYLKGLLIGRTTS